MPLPSLARRVVLVGLVVSIAIAADLRARVTAQTPPTQDAGLKIVVLEGEDAVNIVQQKTAVAPVVEVRDRNDLPVAGVFVTFSIQGAKTASFAGGAQTLSVATNAAGRAAATGFTPLTSGAVQINVTATFQGQTVAATITQTNFMTAAQSASAGSGSSSGGGASGGGVSGKTIALLGAAGAGAGALVVLQSKEEEQGQAVQALCGFTFERLGGWSASVGLAAETLFTFRAGIGLAGSNDCQMATAGMTYQWDFGDGTTSTDPPPVRHVYQNAGTFNVRVTVSDGRNTVSGLFEHSLAPCCTITTVTAAWQVESSCPQGILGTGANNFILNLTQNGASVIGTAAPISGPSGTTGPSTVSGSVSVAGSGGFSLMLGMNTGPGSLNGSPTTFPPSTLNIQPSGVATDPNVLSGFMSPCPGGSTNVVLRRQ